MTPAEFVEQWGGRSAAVDRKLRLLLCAIESHRAISVVRFSPEKLEAAENYADGIIDPARLETARKTPPTDYWWGEWAILNTEPVASGRPAYLRWAEKEPQPRFAPLYLDVLPRRIRLDAGTPLVLTEDGFVRPAGPSEETFGFLAAAPVGSSAMFVRKSGQYSAPLVLDRPQWIVSLVKAMAEQIYWQKEFSSLGILADACSDHGCEDEELLTHLRSPGPHVRGCWALDEILGKW